MEEIVWGPGARELQKLIQDLNHFQLACFVCFSTLQTAGLALYPGGCQKERKLDSNLELPNPPVV